MNFLQVLGSKFYLILGYTSFILARNPPNVSSIVIFSVVQKRFGLSHPVCVLSEMVHL